MNQLLSFTLKLNNNINLISLSNYIQIIVNKVGNQSIKFPASTFYIFPPNTLLGEFGDKYLVNFSAVFEYDNKIYSATYINQEAILEYDNLARSFNLSFNLSFN